MIFQYYFVPLGIAELPLNNGINLKLQLGRGTILLGRKLKALFDIRCKAITKH